MYFGIIYFMCTLSLSCSVDYYELLGISKDADNREIRTAFKKLALKLHPDKIKSAEESSHEKFIAINKAYEILKNEDTRKKYDLYGEEGLKEDFGSSWKGNYRSWNYYSESFGIYDDDPEITTFNKQDFVQYVAESSDFWFVNFYSPQCSHCHHLASAWRELARELQDVVQIGAVNCEEDWILCRQQNIHSYPSLIFYPEKEKYQGSREADSMMEYILQHLPNKVIKLNSNELSNVMSEKYSSKPWLIFSCQDSKGCYDQSDLKKLGVILDNLVNVAVIDDSDYKICNKINCSLSVSYYWKLNSSQLNGEFQELKPIDIDPRTIVQMVYELLPNLIEISDANLIKLLDSEINLKKFTPNLIQFTKTQTRTKAMDVELKRLKAILPEMSFWYFDCDKYPESCFSLYINKFPTYILFKQGGSYEFYHGRITVHNLVRFSREALLSRVQTLTPDNLPTVIESGDTWFIDFFAPWCPPCMELLPQWRKFSQSIGHMVKFGTVDCSTHVPLCRKYNINSYPTTILYNQSMPHKYSGSHSYNVIKDFVQDILHPTVVSLSPVSFRNLLHLKKKMEIWVVDYFAPWCGPCQQLAPQWRKLAKMLQDVPFVHVGEVNCQIHSSLCNSMGINSYPTIHLYPRNSIGTENFFTYNGRSRDANSLQGWIYDFLPSEVELLTSSTFKSILSDKKPWVVDFFVPWCSHCQIFAPEFEKIAQDMQGRVKMGKINCDHYPELCRMAGVRAYPTVLFYGGNKGHATQNPIGEEIDTLTYRGVYLFLSDQLAHSKTQKKKAKDEL